MIDVHVHLRHGDAEHSEYAPETVVQVMDAVGIERSVVFAMSCSTRRSIEMARAAARGFPGRLIPFAYVLPGAEGSVAPDLAQAVTREGVRGFKIHAGECDLADPGMDDVTLRIFAASVAAHLALFGVLLRTRIRIGRLEAALTGG